MSSVANQFPGPTSEPTERAVQRRSAWQAVLSEAGGISAAVSVEGVKRLKFCLQSLQVCWFHVRNWEIVDLVSHIVRNSPY